MTRCLVMMFFFIFSNSVRNLLISSLKLLIFGFVYNINFFFKKIVVLFFYLLHAIFLIRFSPSISSLAFFLDFH